MSASPAAADTCAGCGAELPRGARFCSECGTPAGGGATLKIELPPQETGPVPVTFGRVEPHWFGVTPPTFLLGVACAVLAVAVVLFVSGHWPVGLILLGLAALLLAAFLELARRRPRSAVTRVSNDARERAGSLWETWRARAVVTAEVRRIQSGLALLEAERRTALLELGAAAHGGDEAAEKAIRTRLGELDEREAGLRADLELRVAQAGDRIRRARLSVGDTMMVTPNEPHEPYPPPGEATPPTPAIVPEPYPPPDEGTPPTPAPDPGRKDDD
jgi:zinc ribbon protein